ncbi:MAG: hypothetical protein ABIW79_05050, partial [Gemmatimonas sp.]
DDSGNESLPDLSRRELAVMSVFAVGILWLGLAPQPLLRRIERSSVAVVEAVRFGPNAAPAAATNFSSAR